ncbi:MAG TPA: HAD family phosphatase [Clostridiaceae bacterium]|nr:HAD family phosphatase [Clostridiaceae bacterium]
MSKSLSENKKEEIVLVCQNVQAGNTMLAEHALQEENIIILDHNDSDISIMTQDQKLSDVISEKYLIVFDLDKTLAALGKPIEPETLQCLQELSAAGHHLAIASGKPVFYLMGFCRQANLLKTWMIGENGAQTIFGVDLPPEYRFNVKVKAESMEVLADLKRRLVAKFGDKIWLQPNEIEVTPFFDDEQTRIEIEQFIEEIKDELAQSDIKIYPHSDCFDFLPSNIDKGKAITNLIKWLEIDPRRTIAVGDTWNDQALFEACHYAIAINFPEADKANGKMIHVSDINQALTQIQKIL